MDNVRNIRDQGSSTIPSPFQWRHQHWNIRDHHVPCLFEHRVVHRIRKETKDFANSRVIEEHSNKKMLPITFLIYNDLVNPDCRSSSSWFN